MWLDENAIRTQVCSGRSRMRVVGMSKACAHFANIPVRFSARVSTVWEYIVKAYVEMGTESRSRLPYLRFLGVFGRQVGPEPSDFPTLSCKAAHARHFLQALFRACEGIGRDFDVASLEFRLQVRLLQKLARFYDIICSHGHYLPQALGEEAFVCVKEALKTQNSLGQLYIRRNPALFLFHATLFV